MNAKAFEVSDENSSIYHEIIAAIENSDLYLTPDISLDKLTILTGHSKHLISACINDYAQMNFNNLINKYRIEKAIKTCIESNRRNRVF